MKKCSETGCNKQPNYNYEGKTKGLYCSEHKLDGMVNVKHKRCSETGCNIRPNYGLPGHQATRCKTHILEGMISQPKRLCYTKDCRNIAIYGIGKARNCEIHKCDTDINLIERRCISCGLLNILDGNNKCYNCDPNIYNKVALAKQNRVRCYLDQHNIKYISYDKRLENGVCGNERPDFVFESDSGSHYIVLEVDENQHYGRLEECECTRMANISQSLGLPTIFIRYNPDEFKTNNKKYNPSYNTRMKYLESIIKYTKQFTPEQLTGYCMIRKLYFNGWKETDTNYHIILDFSN